MSHPFDRVIGDHLRDLADASDMPLVYPGRPMLTDTGNAFNCPKVALMRWLEGTVNINVPGGFHGGRALIEYARHKEKGDLLGLDFGLIYPMLKRIFAGLAISEFGSFQPSLSPDGKIFWLGFEQPPADEPGQASLIRLRLCSESVAFALSYLPATATAVDAWESGVLRPEDGNNVAHWAALSINNDLVDAMIRGAGSGYNFGGIAPEGFCPNCWVTYLWRYILAMDNNIFAKRNGPMTHLVVGTDALGYLRAAGAKINQEKDATYSGLPFCGEIESPAGQKYKLYQSTTWGSETEHSYDIMGFRRGQEWSDAPIIFASQGIYPQTSEGNVVLMQKSVTKVLVSAISRIRIMPGHRGSTL